MIKKKNYQGEIQGKLGAHARTGAFIRSRREALGISQSPVGEAIGYTAQFISRIETGHVPLPRKHITALAKVLRIDADHIISAMVQDYEDALKLSVTPAPTPVAPPRVVTKQQSSSSSITPAASLPARTVSPLLRLRRVS